jgi:hypothetical protein
MARQKGTSRVTKPKSDHEGTRAVAEDRFPPLWKRKPGMFAVIVLGTLAMVVPLVAGIVTVLFT